MVMIMNFKNKIYAVCYNSLHVFDTKKDARKFFDTCYHCSEGAEQQRYASILIELDSSNFATDNVSNICRDINVIKNHGTMKIGLKEPKCIDDCIEYFKNIINPILEISNNYNIKFNSKVPFEDFGSDEESEYMYSYSDFYNDIFHDKNIELIETNEISDGKYELNVYPNVGSKISLEITAWDKLENVIDNIENINKQLSKDNDLEM